MMSMKVQQQYAVTDLLLFIWRRKAVHFLVQLIYMEGICGDVFPMSMGGF